MLTYFWIGLIWTIIHEFTAELTNGQRVRLFLLWPFTMIAFFTGMFIAWRDRNNE